MIGHLLGIHDALLPHDLAEARQLQALIFGRQQAASVVGADLTATLLGLLGPGAAAGGRAGAGDAAAVHR